MSRGDSNSQKLLDLWLGKEISFSTCGDEGAQRHEGAAVENAGVSIRQGRDYPTHEASQEGNNVSLIVPWVPIPVASDLLKMGTFSQEELAALFPRVHKSLDALQYSVQAAGDLLIESTSPPSSEETANASSLPESPSDCTPHIKVVEAACQAVTKKVQEIVSLSRAAAGKKCGATGDEYSKEAVSEYIEKLERENNEVQMELQNCEEEVERLVGEWQQLATSVA